MAPKVSILMAAYNAGQTIAETIECLLSQTFTDFELIIVDDGSTDTTQEIIDSFAQTDKRVKYIWQKNARHPAARNRGLQVCIGKYVAIIDADDLWTADKLARQMELMQDEDDLIVLTGNTIFYEENGERVWGHSTFPPPTKDDRYTVFDILMVHLNQMAMFNTGLIPKEVLVRLGGYNEKILTAEDWELWLKTVVECRFKVIEEPLMFYRKHAQSYTSGTDLYVTLLAHEEIIFNQYRWKYISKKELAAALFARRIHMCELYLYRKELFSSLQALGRALRIVRCWHKRELWLRVSEVVRLAFKKIAET